MNILKLKVGLLMAIISLMACNSDNKKENGNVEPIKEETVTADKNPASTLEGAWEIMRAEGMSVKSNLGTVYTFKGDNLSMGKGGFNNPGKTEITDSTFTFQADGNEYKFLFHYHFDGDTLITSMDNSNGQHFYMVKKE